MCTMLNIYYQVPIYVLNSLKLKTVSAETVVYLSGTEEHSPWLGALSVKLLEFKVSRLA